MNQMQSKMIRQNRINCSTDRSTLSTNLNIGLLQVKADAGAPDTRISGNLAAVTERCSLGFEYLYELFYLGFLAGAVSGILTVQLPGFVWLLRCLGF